MRALSVLAVAGALGLAGLVAGCGADRSKLVPRDAAADINGQLEAASIAVGEQECREAEDAVDRAADRALDLPRSVDPELRKAIETGLVHVDERIEDECGREEPTTTTPTTTVPTPTQPEPEPTPTVPEPTPTVPEPTPTQPEPEPPRPGPGSGGTPSDDGGGGGGDGGDLRGVR